MSNENKETDSNLQVEQMDPAQQQLARALRSSFRLLSFLMIVVLILFAVSEVTSIGPNQVGIVYRFGRMEDVVEEGLAYAWPFMIGKVEKLDISQKEIEINDFWVFETPSDRTKPLMERRVSDEGLRPGYDGALLTGDNGLYHVRFRCGYKIRSEKDRITEDVHPAIQYKLNVGDDPDARKIIRSVICSAAIRLAGGLTVNELNSNRGQFADEVQAQAQKQLDDLLSGMRIVNVSVVDGSWPLQTLGAFAEADAAQRRNSAVLDRAKAQAERILQLVAGKNYRYFVGDPINQKAQSDKDKKAEKPFDLIGLYAKSRMSSDGGDTKQSEEILKTINQELPKTKGATRKLIDNAQTQSTEFIESTKRRARRFAELLPKYKENPEFMLTAEWTKVLSTIFSSPTVEVIVVGAGEQKINIQTKQDPDTAARILRELAKVKNPRGAAQNK
jgi:regulator of protease activity HflC (stomatin/prohibitin superfamily)